MTLKTLIPKPMSIVAGDGKCRLAELSFIMSPSAHLSLIASYLSDALRVATGVSLVVIEGTNSGLERSVTLSLGDEAVYGAEGYRLSVMTNQISIEAAHPAGVFYGVQTLLQLIPSSGEAEVECCVITDQPRFTHRAMMLDVARHFFPVEDVKHLIDIMALYKLNKLHLHLTDDQGWRIEIKSWPNLTAHGAQTQVGGGGGGFYTQAEYADIVAYAAERYIDIIPEIDMPGHTNAALSSYPDLNADGVAAPPLYTGVEVGFSTLTVGKTLTYQFIDDVVREVAALSPCPYFHIGGDESHATPLEDYRTFISRVQDIITSHGKTMIGWEEIGQAPIARGTIAQHWFSDFARQAVAQGGKVICSPAKRIYLDMKYDEACPLGLTWSGMVNTQQSYEWDPATLMDGVSEADIIGVEAPLWTETIQTRADIEYMVFPRLLGVSEIAWSSAQARTWDEYRERLSAHGRRLAARGVNFYRDPCVDWS